MRCAQSVSACLLALVACLLVLAPAAGATPSEGIHNIKHVVVIMQENRSFDSYFGTYPGANGIPAGVCLPDRIDGCVAPFHDPNPLNWGGPHGFGGAKKDIAGGTMNGFEEDGYKENACEEHAERCVPCTYAQMQASEHCIDIMAYHDAREIPNYWTYAHEFVLQDNMFQSALTWSGPEHDYLVSGWAARCPTGDPNPMDCLGTLDFPTNERTWTDVTYMLHRAGVSWGYYVFEGEEPDCEVNEEVVCKPVRQGAETYGPWNPLVHYTDVKEDGQLGNIQSITHFYEGAHQTGTCGLPDVSWLAPTKGVSEHPRFPINRGQAYVTTVVNTIMRSPCWNSTAIFVSWDDWGGFYDHVQPPSVDSSGWGLRVPGLVISPYAKRGFIDSQPLSHDAYLKFIEDDFLEGQRLNPKTDGRPDARPDVREESTQLGSLAEDFEFNQSPRAPVLLSPNPAPGPPSAPPDGPPQPPTVETGTATGTTSGTSIGATLRAKVDPNAVVLHECTFEYGPTTSYGTSVSCTSVPGAAGEPVTVSASIKALTAHATYHFRVAAGSEGGHASGKDVSFVAP